AIHQVERRLRGLGQPPRSVAEMAEWLRRLGDLAPSELEGPMAAFLEELEGDGRVRSIQLPAMRQPQRWILAANDELYRTAFGAQPAQEAAETILLRFLATPALVGLADILERYPFERRWVRHRLAEWEQTGRLVAVRHAGASDAESRRSPSPEGSRPPAA